MKLPGDDLGIADWEALGNVHAEANEKRYKRRCAETLPPFPYHDGVPGVLRFT